jgi:hypothetical protein
MGIVSALCSLLVIFSVHVTIFDFNLFKIHFPTIRMKIGMNLEAIIYHSHYDLKNNDLFL